VIACWHRCYCSVICLSVLSMSSIIFIRWQHASRSWSFGCNCAFGTQFLGMGRSYRGSAIVPFERAKVVSVSYKLSIVTIALSLTIRPQFAQTAENIDTIYLAYDDSIATCLFHIALQFGSHRSTPTSQNLVSKWPTFCWFERRRHSTANFGRMVRDIAMVTLESL